MKKSLLFFSILSIMPTVLYSMQKTKNNRFKEFSARAQMENFSYFEHPYYLRSINQTPVSPSGYHVYYYQMPIDTTHNNVQYPINNIVGARFYRKSSYSYQQQKIEQSTYNNNYMQQAPHQQVAPRMNVLKQVNEMAKQQRQSSSMHNQYQKKNSYRQEKANIKSPTKRLEKIVFNKPNMLEHISNVAINMRSHILQQNSHLHETTTDSHQ